MTGTIQVNDPSGSYPTPTPGPPPRYLTYSVDIDNREIWEDLTEIRPSTERGIDLSVDHSDDWTDPTDPDLRTPLDAYGLLDTDPATQDLTDAERWDLLASLWIEQYDQNSLALGRQIYDSNCAACHGPSGGGDGVMARHFTDPPVADFTDLARMATANPVLLEGKILRGGMGTGMPYWGPILAESEIDAVIMQLWDFLFNQTAD
jgi:hypothetical protein